MAASIDPDGGGGSDVGTDRGGDGVPQRPGSFVGAKGGEGVYQRIISWMPPHDVYVEPFAGTAAVFRHKRPAMRSILIDDDPGALDRIGDASSLPGVEVYVGDGIEWLRRARFAEGLRVVVYCDPPYVRDARRNGERDYYRHDWGQAEQEYFLDAAVDAGSRPLWSVLISGYDSALYRDRLVGWSVDSYPAATRGGLATEFLWANFPRPDRLHDYRYIGTDFEERWRIRKRQRSWVRMLRRMPPLERRAMLAAIIDSFGGGDLPDGFGEGGSAGVSPGGIAEAVGGRSSVGPPGRTAKIGGARAPTSPAVALGQPGN